MKKSIFLICATVCCTIFAEWHSWDTPPQKDQIYMTVNMCPGVHYTKRQILIISYYHSDKSIRGDGWWDVTPYTVFHWFNEGSKILYLPSEIDHNFVERMENLIK